MVSLTGLGLLVDRQAKDAAARHEVALQRVLDDVAAGEHLAQEAGLTHSAGQEAVAGVNTTTASPVVVDDLRQQLVQLSRARDALVEAGSAARRTARQNTGDDIDRVLFWRLGDFDRALDQVSLTDEVATVVETQRLVNDDTDRLEDAEVAAPKGQEPAAAAAVESPDVEHAAAAAAPAPPAQQPEAAPATSSKLDIAQQTFDRFGFTGVSYGPGVAQGHYAGTDLDAQHIYVDLDRIPAARVASVCIHEYMHILQARAYGGRAGTIAHFGSVAAMERDADRSALLNGATWTHYL